MVFILPFLWICRQGYGKALTLCLSTKMVIVHNSGLSDAQMKKPSAIIKAMERYAVGYTNEAMKYHKFNCQIQQQGGT